MVKEQIWLNWNDINLHKSLKDFGTKVLEVNVPGWVEEGRGRPTNQILLKRLEGKEDSIHKTGDYVYTTWNEVSIHCEGEYGTNLQKIRDAKLVIRKLANLSETKIRWLERKKCEAIMNCYSIPTEINIGDEALKGLIETANKVDTKRSRLEATYLTDKNTKYELGPRFFGIKMRCTCLEFEKRYETSLSKIFTF